MEDLPTEYDAIVLGTGMTESIIAAALSRIGKSVLHLDCNEFYGENWASFNLEGIEEWIKSYRTPTETPRSIEDYVQLINEGETVILSESRTCVSNIQEIWVCPRKCQEDEKEEKEEEEEEEEKSDIDDKAENEATDENKEISDSELVGEENAKNEEDLKWTVDKIKNEYRKFNLDLCPKVLFSRGSLVELLISSNIARYAEFKSVNRVLTWRKGHLEPVPCSRADVFATKNVSVVQKRMLVKILTLFAEYPDNEDEFQGFENKTFLEYLKHKKLPENLIHYLLYAIAMGTNNTPCIDGVKSAKAFLKSLGRYGSTPFIFPMYGSGELPQCFCRLCAVFGGVYHLKRGIEAFITKGNHCCAVISNGQRLNAKYFVLSSAYAPQSYLCDQQYDGISRGIFITDKSILKSEKEPLTLLRFPPLPQVSENCVTLIELGPATHACPSDLFVVHMTTKKTNDASSDLNSVVKSLFGNLDNSENDEQRPNVLWSLSWNLSQGSDKTSENCPENVKICSGPDLELDFDFSIDQARRLFSELCPDEDFLPRAPDPDEIVLDDIEGESKPLEEASPTPEKADSEEYTTAENTKTKEPIVQSGEEVKSDS